MCSKVTLVNFGNIIAFMWENCSHILKSPKNAEKQIMIISSSKIENKKRIIAAFKLKVKILFTKLITFKQQSWKIERIFSKSLRKINRILVKILHSVKLLKK